MDLDRIFRDFISRSGLGFHNLSTYFSIPISEWRSWWFYQSPLPISDLNVISLEKYFKVSFDRDSFEDEQIYRVRESLWGEPWPLPERYAQCPKSYVRSSYYITEYLALLYGRRAVDKVMLSMGVHPRYIENLDRRINIIFVNDLLSHCHQLGFKIDDFNNLARSMFISVEKSKSQKTLFSEINSYQDFYNRFAKMTSTFDENFVYDFNIRNNSVELVNQLDNEVNEVIKKNNINLSMLYQYRSMLFFNAPALAGLTSSPLVVHNCLSRGDGFIRYTTKFNNSFFPS